MGLSLSNLDATTRRLMVQEFEHDLQNNTLYISPRLNATGIQQYPQLLKDSLTNYDDAWLAQALRRGELFNTTEARRKPTGGFTNAKIPVTAPETLAEGEFNRFYVRGVCLRVIEEGRHEVEVYRAKAVSTPRYESEVKIGTLVSAQQLLDDLRTHQGIDTALGLPAGPNSGLSVRIPG